MNENPTTENEPNDAEGVGSTVLLATSKEKAWMRRLKKCLKEMPQGRCLRVSINYGNKSTIGLLSEEVNDQIDNDSDVDRMKLNIGQYFVDEFDADRVIADSECI